MVFAEPEHRSSMPSPATTAAAISESSSLMSSSDFTRLPDDITEAVEQEGRTEGDGIQNDSVCSSFLSR